MPCDLWFVGVFEGEEVVFDVIMMIRLSFDIQIQDVRHLENGSLKSVALFHKTHENESVTKKCITYTESRIQLEDLVLYKEPDFKKPTSWMNCD